MPSYQPMAKLENLCTGFGGYSVYIHIFPNGKRYIGLTSRSLNRRWQNGNGYNSQQLMARAVTKYGWDNVQHILICDKLSKNDAEMMERMLILSYDSNNKSKGYNIENGGSSKGRVSEETKKKLSDIHKGKQTGEQNPMYGKKHSEESKKKISEANKGKPSARKGVKLSQETKIKISKGHMGIRRYGRKISEETREKMRRNRPNMSGSNNPMFGKHHTGETRRKISENRNYTTGADHPSSKKVIQLTLDGKFVNIWDSCTIAINEFIIGKNSGTIKACCQGRTKTAYGYKWFYLNEYEKLQHPKEGVF